MKNTDTTLNHSKIPVEFVVAHHEKAQIKFINVVTASVAGVEIKEETDFLQVLRGALTKWIKNTVEGRNAWNYSCGDFNIGDLGNEYATDSSLKDYLEDAGIFDFSIGTYECGSRNWIHDTVLVDAEEVTTDEEDEQ